MLSRFNSLNLQATHRWYRIVGTIGEPDEEGIVVTDPVNGVDRTVKQHTVILDGADWEFFGGAGVVDDTFVTIVDDVVLVHEHLVRIDMDP